MQATPTRHESLKKLVVFMLLGLFLLLSMLLVLLGAQAYKANNDRVNAHNTQRVLSAYIRSAMQAEDNADSIAVLEKDGVCVLAVRYGADEEDAACRYIFCAEGELQEKYQLAERQLVLSGGETICAAEKMEAALEDGCLRVNVTDAQGNEQEVCIALRTTQSEWEGTQP